MNTSDTTATGNSPSTENSAATGNRATPESISAGRQTALFDSSERISGYERSPEDLLRFLTFLAASLIVLFLSTTLGKSTANFEESVVDLVGISSSVAIQILYGILVALAAAVAILTLLVPLITRRFRLFGYVVAANLLAGFVMGWIDALVADSAELTNQWAAQAGISDLGPDGIVIAQTAAAFTVFSPFITSGWRKTLWVVLGILVFLQMTVSVHPPLSTAAALVVGPLAGSAILLAFGRPSSRPTIDAIITALRANGFSAADLQPADVDARGSTPYIATLDDGTRLFAKVLGANERAADLMFRYYRRFRLKNVGDEPPDSSLRRTVEHEALVALSARDRGLRTPRLRTVSSVGSDSFLLAYELIPGRSLDSADESEVTDAVLGELWREVLLLQEMRIAHRDLRLANVFLGDDAEPWIIDFGFSEVAAPDDLLNADIAQLLTSLALMVGIERSIDSAVGVLGEERACAALGRLQTAALSGATQSELKEQPGLLDELRGGLARRCDQDDFEMVPLVRFKPSNGLVLASAVAITYLLMPILAGVPEFNDVLSQARWQGTTMIGVAVLIGLMGATLLLKGASRRPLARTPTFLLQFASDFATTTAPARYGGDRLQMRFLMRHGLEEDEASLATATARMSHVAIHAALLIVFAAIVGSQSLIRGGLNGQILLKGGIGVIAVAMVALAVPSVRQRVSEHLQLLRHRGRGNIGRLFSSPRATAAVLIGASLSVGMQVAAFQISSDVLDLAPGLAVVGAVYLVGAAVASIAPTPGHLVAIELALTIGLVGVGVSAAAAVACVLMYRAISFWLVVLAGWGAFNWLRTNSQI